MKSKRFTAILAIFSLFVLGGAAAMAGADDDHGNATKNAVVSTFEVNGMTCGGCSSGLRLQVKKLEGVEDVKVSHEDSFASVTYDPGQGLHQGHPQGHREDGLRGQAAEDRAEGRLAPLLDRSAEAPRVRQPPARGVSCVRN